MSERKLRITDHHKTFKMLAHLAWNRCNANNDFICFINGDRGSGKSTAGVQFLRYYLEAFLNVKLTRKILREHICVDVDTLTQRVHHLPDKHPILIDEGVLAAYVGDYAKRNVKELFKLFTVCRTKNRSIIIVTPSFTDVMTRLRNYALYRIRMVKRGVGLVFAKDISEGSAKDPFHLEALKKMEGYYDENTPPELIVRKLRKHLCFKDTVKISRLPKNVEAWYEEYRNEMVYESKQGRDRTLNERLAIVYYNLSRKWDELKERKKITQIAFIQELYVDPVTGKQIVARTNHLSSALKSLKNKIKIEERFQLLKVEKEQREREEAGKVDNSTVRLNT